MPANRSRTTRWRRCLEQIHERNGAIEIGLCSPETSVDGSDLLWRVRVVDLSPTELIVEQPLALPVAA